MKNSACLLAAFVLACSLAGSGAEGRQILVCTGSQASPAIRQAAADFLPGIESVPLFKALRAAQDADGASLKTSDDLLAAKAYDTAAHNHLVVIGLPSQDPLLAKVWGFDVSVDEAKKQFYSTGWGYLEGDIGWVESDRNPFLHSRRVPTAPEDTLLVKISGTSEAGVLAALRAFQGGMLNGFVPAGPLRRPQTTLLDRDPMPEAFPAALPDVLSQPAAFLAGWSQVPGNEYRAVLEAGGIEPEKMWRYKYLASRILEEKPVVRWFGGVNARAMGNAVDLVQFKSHDDALAAARAMTKVKFEAKQVPGLQEAWQVPWVMENSESIQESYGKVLVTTAGSCLLLSSLPEGATAQVAATVR